MKRTLPPVFMILALFAAVTVFLTGFGRAEITSMPQNPDLVASIPADRPKAVFAGGCFWCLESEFRNRPGVVYTRAGYAGGHVDNPTYDMVTTGTTGHAETIEIYYDPSKTDYRQLVDYFLRNAHDPTTLNKQWVDEGPQYRSMIFYTDAEQKRIAQDTIDTIDAEKIYKGRIVTELVPAATFWIAEAHHQQYYETYERNKGTPHLRVVMKKALKDRGQKNSP